MRDSKPSRLLPILLGTLAGLLCAVVYLQNYKVWQILLQMRACPAFPNSVWLILHLMQGLHTALLLRDATLRSSVLQKHFEGVPLHPSNASESLYCADLVRI